ncbi:MAG: hypothetical protein J6V21_00270 [Alistipes sp.]|nr:hypothetical protein [Alistipes sp.]
MKVRIEGQRVKYNVARVTFDENDLQQAKSWQWDYRGNTLYYNDNKLDIVRDYETFDSADIGVAVRNTGEIYYELGDDKGKLASRNVLYSPYHPMLITIEDANDGDGLTLLTADVYDKKNTIYEYTVEVGEGETFDASLLAIIAIRCPITDEERLVQLLYAGKEMEGGAEGLSFKDEPMSKNSMLTVPNDYAVALGLGENRKLDNILRFDDFIKENCGNRKKPANKVKSVKDFVKIREDYIHSFIDEHERGVEPDEEE